ncbi:MAG: hypothetical protein O7F16_11640 [Acidobacteria bacterium]|nr:hypothetical protein [Acidobacteriota bacterium]
MNKSNRDYLIEKLRPLCGAKLQKAVYDSYGEECGFIRLYLVLPSGRTGIIDIMGDEEGNVGGWPLVDLEPWECEEDAVA